MVAWAAGGGVHNTGLPVEVEEHLVLLLELLRPKLQHSDVGQPRGHLEQGELYGGRI